MPLFRFFFFFCHIFSPVALLPCSITLYFPYQLLEPLSSCFTASYSFLIISLSLPFFSLFPLPVTASLQHFTPPFAPSCSAVSCIYLRIKIPRGRSAITKAILQLVSFLVLCNALDGHFHAITQCSLYLPPARLSHLARQLQILRLKHSHDGPLMKAVIHGLS